MRIPKTTGGASVGPTVSVKEKLDAIKAVAESGKSTQETIRQAIGAESDSNVKFLDMLREQSRKADTPEERAKIRQEGREAQAQFSAKVKAFTEDSNNVFRIVVGFAVVATRLVIANNRRRS